MANLGELGGSFVLDQGVDVVCECREVPSKLVAVAFKGLLNGLLVELCDVLLGVLEVGIGVFGQVVGPNGAILGLHVGEPEDAVLLRLRHVIPGGPGTKLKLKTQQSVPMKKQPSRTSRGALPELSGRHFEGCRSKRAGPHRHPS